MRFYKAHLSRLHLGILEGLANQLRLSQLIGNRDATRTPIMIDG